MEVPTVPAQKLRPLNSVRSTTGCSSVSSQARKKAKPTTAVTAKPTISGEANQSCSLPRSSTICKAAIHTISRARPMRSMGSLRTTLSRGW